MLINATDMKRGMAITQEGALWIVVDTMHVTPGNWRGFVNAKIKNLADGRVLQKRFRSNEKVEQAFLENREYEYLYEEPPSYVFMDTESFEQVRLDAEIVGEQMQYITHNSKVKVTFHGEKPISIELPTSVVLKVTETDPGVKGDTVSNVYKPAKLETGLVVKVPLHIAQGNTVKVDTRTGEFVERVSF